MRLAGWLLLVLLAAGWALSTIPVTETPASEPSVPQWRRTCDGWQRCSAWTARPPVRSPGLHPMIVGALQVLVSVGALIAFPGRSRRAESETAGTGRAGTTRGTTAGERLPTPSAT